MIYTRRGDAGDTDLCGGLRLSKHELRVDSYGSVDEANAMIGVVLAQTDHDVRPCSPYSP